MMVTEKTTVADAALPLLRFREHLRLGSGFVEDHLQNGLLAGFLRAAMAAIEGRTGKVLMEREFEWRQDSWRNPQRAIFPITPVTSVLSVVMKDVQGHVKTIPSTEWRLKECPVSPMLLAGENVLPAIPQNGVCVVTFRAGYGASFADLPADLAQAIMLLAAHYYEYRDETALGQGCMPFGVTALIDRYRPIRLTLGAAI